MSFTFNWPRFSDQFHYHAIQMLNTALNKGDIPPIIADTIEVVELEMGSQPPELEIRDIGDLTVDHFRGIFRLTYAGDAHLVLKTKVQANPLNHKQPDIHLMGGSRGMLAAKHPLVVPMLLRLSHFRLSSYVVLVVSKQKGITLVFKTDPLQNVDINSTFDSIAVIQNFIQREIEGQLRQMFREDLPGIIHRLSQQWVKAKVEAPYLAKRPPPTPLPSETRPSFDSMSAPDVFPHRATASETGIRKPPLSSNSRRPPRAASTSGHSRRPHSTSFASAASTPHLEPSSSSSHPDLENFDPTYGLRPEGLPIKSVFKNFSSLFTPNKGLADLAEEAEEEKSNASAFDSDYEYEEETEEEDEAGSFDFVDWDDQRDREQEYETIPAVGGGTITRPRVYHSQSAIQTHPFSTNASTSAASRSTARPHMSRSLSSLPPQPLASAPVRSYSIQSSASNPYFPEYPPSSSGVPGPSRSRPRHPSHLSLSSSAANVVGVPLRTAPPGPGYPYAPLPSTLRRSETPDSSEFDSPFSSSRSSSGPSTRRSTISPGMNMRLNGGPVSASAIYMRRPLSERRLSVGSEMTARTSSTLHNPNDEDESTVSLLQPSSSSRHPHPLHANNAASQSQNSLLSTSPSSHTVHGTHNNNTNIVLRPSLNSSSIHKLSTLSTSNHTLSPYTRNLSHFTVRSVPPRSASGSSGGLGALGLGAGTSAAHNQERAPVKARRKRTYRLGGRASSASAPNGAPDVESADPTKRRARPNSTRRPRQHQGRHSPVPPSEEFDESDMDRYFTYDDDEPTPSPPAPQSSGPMQSPNRGVPPPPSTSMSSSAATPRRMSSRPRLASAVGGGGQQSSPSATATATGVAPRMQA